MPEITDLTTDPELSWVSEILAHAKELMLKNGDLAPMFFVISPTAGRCALPLSQIGDINKDEDKDRMAEVMRAMAAQTGATRCAQLTDAWMNEFLPEYVDWARVPANESRFLSMTAEEKKKYARRREVILVQVETGAGKAFLWQYYRRVGPRGRSICFDECRVERSGAAGFQWSGRFANILGTTKGD